MLSSDDRKLLLIGLIYPLVPFYFLGRAVDPTSYQMLAFVFFVLPLGTWLGLVVWRFLGLRFSVWAFLGFSVWIGLVSFYCLYIFVSASAAC